jgi:hypothetical protein
MATGPRDKAEEGPETNHEDHRAWRLSRNSTGSVVGVLREVEAGQAKGVLTGTGSHGAPASVLVTGSGGRDHHKAFIRLYAF